MNVLSAFPQPPHPTLSPSGGEGTTDESLSPSGGEGTTEESLSPDAGERAG